MTPSCAGCGGPLTAASSAGGLCASCLLATALADDAESPLDEEGSLAPGTVLGSFRIVRVLGRGGMATVYEARDDRLDRAVALKVLPPEFLHDPRFAERFEQEARIVAALEHPNIVPIHASAIDRGIPWMSMRLLTGGTIGTLLERGRLDAAAIVRLLRPVADALDYAHAHGVVHRDIKPTNILLDGTGGVCVGDFGLAHMLDAHSRMTRSGLLAGTPHYMAPEQALGKTPDHRCDIYSLAIVAYEMFVGVTPFTADSPVALLMKHANDSLPEPPDGVVPWRIMRAIHKGAEKDPADRWPSATAFVDALDAAVGDRRQLTRSGFIRSLQLTRRAGWMGAFAAAALAAAVGWVAIRGADAPVAGDPVPVDVAAPPPAATPAAPISSPASESTVPVEMPATSARRPPGNRNQPVSKSAGTQPAAPVTESAPPSVPPPGAPPGVVSSAPAPHVTASGDVPSRSTTDAQIPIPVGIVPARPLLADVVKAAARIRTVDPEYPQAALAAQLEGDVLLEAVVTPDGTVTTVSIVRSVHPLLDESARKAVMQYQYTPATRNGVPEPATVRMTVSFRLR